MKLRTPLCLAAAALLLTACATPLAGKPPKEAAMLATQSNIQQASYNFAGEVGIRELVIRGKEGDLVGRFAKDEMVNEIARSLRIEFKGALDLPTARVEFVPTLQFTRPHAGVWVRVPMLAKLDSMQLWLDGNLLDLMVPQLRNKLVLVEAPVEMVKTVPVKALLQELPTIAGKLQNAIDQKAYTFQPLGKEAKALGASYQIRVQLGDAEVASINRELLLEMNRLAEKYVPEGDEREDAKRVLRKIGKLLSNHQDNMQQTHQTDLLVSRGGQLLAIVEEHSQQDKEGTMIRYGGVTRLSAHGKPVFTIVPGADNVVRFADVPWPWKRGAVGESEDGDEPDSEQADASAAVVAKP